MDTAPSPKRHFSGARAVLDFLATISVIIAAGAMIWTSWPKQPPKPPLPTKPVSIENAATIGSLGSKVGLIVYSDVQCPYCAEFFRNILPTIADRFVTTGDVLIAFRHLPIERIHPLALQAASAVECSRRQGKFVEMQQSLFAQPQHLDEPSLLAQAESLGLEMHGFGECLHGDSIEQIRKDQSEAKALYVSRTPTIFVGSLTVDRRVQVRQRMSGTPNPGDLEAAIMATLHPRPALGSVVAAVSLCVVLSALAAGLVVVRRRRRLRYREPLIEGGNDDQG